MLRGDENSVLLCVSAFRGVGTSLATLVLGDLTG